MRDKEAVPVGETADREASLQLETERARPQKGSTYFVRIRYPTTAAVLNPLNILHK